MILFLRASLLMAITSAFQPSASSSLASHSHQHQHQHKNTKHHILLAAPKEALPDIVIPNVFNFGNTSISKQDLENEDPRVWVPQTDCLSFRPLCFCTSQGCKYVQYSWLLYRISYIVYHISYIIYHNPLFLTIQYTIQ
jgi:hypothetical protein